MLLSGRHSPAFALIAAQMSIACGTAGRPATVVPNVISSPDDGAPLSDFEVTSVQTCVAVVATEDRLYALLEDRTVLVVAPMSRDSQLTCSADSRILPPSLPHASVLTVAACSASQLSDFGPALRICASDGRNEVECIGSNASETLVPGRDTHLSGWEPVHFPPQPKAASMACSSTCVAVSDQNVACSGPVHTAEGRAISGVTLEGPNEEGQVQLCAGSEYHCALRGGRVWCWGFNRSGQVSELPSFDGTAVARVPPMGNLSNALALYCGLFAACAVTSSRSLTCWGNFVHFTGGRSPRNFDFESDIIDVAVTTNQVCALQRNHTVACYRRLPGASTMESYSYRLGSLEFSSIYAGDGWLCGLSNAGGLACLREGARLCAPTSL